MALPVSPQQNLKPLLNAQSVAIIGISRPGNFGGQVYANLRDFGYRGQIYGVNPRYQSLYDQICYPTLSDLPDRPDCAVLAVPNARLVDALQEAAQLNIPAAVIFASAHSGHAANGQPSLQTQLAQIAQAAGMSICGPNCMGFFSLGRRLAISGYQSLPNLPNGRITLISHSGSIWDAFLQNRRGVHFNYAISSGNEMVTTLADYMQFALTDPETRVIALFLETVRDPQTFTGALAQAAERDVPVVALKVGRSRRGAQLAQAHSGALAGEDAAYEALFEYYGARRVKSPDEMMNTLELLATGARPSGRYVSALLDSGGERAMLVDLAETEGVEFAPLDAQTVTQLTQLLDPGLDPVNPLDAWGTGNDYEKIYQNCLLALDANPASSLNIFAVDFCAAQDFSDSYTRVVQTVQPQLANPLVILTHLTAAASEAQVANLRQLGIPVLMDTENGLRAIRHLLEYCRFQRERAAPATNLASGHSPPPQLAGWRQTLRRAGGPLDEVQSKQLLRLYGLTLPDEVIANSLHESLQVAEKIGYPVALKTAAAGPHKSDQGGIQLNIGHADALTTAYRRLAQKFGPRVLVQQMVPQGVELLLGLVNDPQFGPMLMLGSGGIFVEILNDRRLLLLPTTPEKVRRALLSLRGAALLQGARGTPPVDIDAVVAAAMQLAALAANLGDMIAEIDINPLIALPHGAVVVDALIVPNEQ